MTTDDELGAGPVDPDARGALADLRERLAEKSDLLRDAAESHYHPGEAERLGGKAEGVDLAISFVDEYLRAAAGSPSPTPPDDASPLGTPRTEGEADG